MREGGGDDEVLRVGVGDAEVEGVWALHALKR
jgi:hypothetical protein